MKEQIKTVTEELLNETIENVQKIVRIPSVRNVEDATETAVFGKAVGEALDEFLQMCADINMRTYRDPEGYYGYAEIGPEDAKEMVGILGHIDVVPAGDESQWTEAASFSGDIVDEKIIGRGTLDDKGPMVLNVMAIKALQEIGFTFNKRVRLIVGAAEETTWECINKYNEKEEMPTTGFSPDANYPLINAEKTISQFDIIGNVDVDFTVESLGAYNAVADNAKYTGSKTEQVAKELDALGYEYTKKGNEIIVSGRGAHAMACHLGVNAITRLAEAMHKAGETTKGIEFLATKVGETKHAELIQGVVEEEVSGKLMFNIGNIVVKDGQEKIGCDTRVPVLADEKEIFKTYEAAVIEDGLEINQGKIQEKLYVAEDDYLVATLLKVYRDVTGDTDAKPLSSGGGTYARAMKEGVAFGMVFAKEGMIDKMHQPNECLEIKFIQPALEIYTNAIYELSK